MLSKKILEINNLKKPTRGRPKNKFVSHRYYWCMPFLTFCDIARESGLCREEAPRHTMPIPFEDFNCSKFLLLPTGCFTSISPEEMNKILQLSVEKVVEATIGLVDCEIKVASVKKIKNKNEIQLDFEILIAGKHDIFTTKNFIVIVNLDEETAVFV